MSRPDSNGEILLRMASRCARGSGRVYGISFSTSMAVRGEDILRADDGSPLLLRMDSMKLQLRFQLEKEGEVVGSVS